MKAEKNFPPAAPSHSAATFNKKCLLVRRQLLLDQERVFGLIPEFSLIHAAVVAKEELVVYHNPPAIFGLTQATSMLLQSDKAVASYDFG
ncbi:hypothetical protein LPW11_14755 [Geomonas sp. RF6]|uniref:hypothetical protein n=1 Tax=Geomonas sp. RF6 TaxID=2897342 RepID=UPI001E5C5794|nr:hypothetical protein [Geomonas sp. RF6]UFS69151.1 hypothetical protein LPW11_14755 [Geomonas sp. RF6]